MSKKSAPRILIVDDDEQVVRLLRLVLERRGCSCLTACSGGQAWSLFMNGDIDIIVTDLKMSLGDGVAFVEAVRRVSNVPVLVVSGFEREYANQVQYLKNVSVFSKPVDMAELLRTIRTCHRQSINVKRNQMTSA